MKISLGANLIYVKDVTKGKEWLEKIFGMETIDFDPENLFVRMKLGDAIFYVEAPNKDLAPGFQNGSVGVRTSAVFLADDIEAFMREAEQKGAKIIVHAVKQFYGGIDGVVGDLDGNEFVIHQKEE